MIKTLLNTALLGAMTFGSIASAQVPFSVNGQTISVQNQKDLMSALAEQGITEEVQQAALAKTILIERVVIAQEARRLNIDQRSDVKEKTENAKHGILLEALSADYLHDKKPSDAELDKIYEDIKNGYDPNFIQISQIVVKTEPEAKDIIKRLNNGADFAELAKELSIDPQAKTTGGLLPMANVKSFQVPGLAQTALSVEEGTVVQSPFRANLDTGYLVVRVDKKETRPVPNKEALSKQIEELWTRQTLNNYFTDLVKQAKVVNSYAPAKK